jgi:hypothetical protein
MEGELLFLLWKPQEHYLFHLSYKEKTLSCGLGEIDFIGKQAVF